MLMFGKENDQDKNIWKSTIIIRKKHFLNMVKKYYKDIMDEDVTAKCYSYKVYYGGVFYEDINDTDESYREYKIKIIKDDIINSVYIVSEYILNKKDLGNVFDYNIGKDLSNDLGNYKLNDVNISALSFHFEVKTGKDLGQKVKIKK